jgi:hypothetical protein
MLGAVLRQIHRSGLVPHETFQHLFDVEDPYPYFSARPARYNQVHNFFRNCKSIPAQQSILDHLTAGTGWTYRHLETNQDLNGDGVVDTADILDGALQTNKTLARLLVTTREEQRHGMRHISADRAAELSAAITESLTQLLAVQQVVAFLTPSQTRRSA